MGYWNGTCHAWDPWVDSWHCTAYSLPNPHTCLLLQLNKENFMYIRHAQSKHNTDIIIIIKFHPCSLIMTGAWGRRGIMCYIPLGDDWQLSVCVWYLLHRMRPITVANPPAATNSTSRATVTPTITTRKWLLWCTPGTALGEFDGCIHDDVVAEGLILKDVEVEGRIHGNSVLLMLLLFWVLDSIRIVGVVALSAPAHV